MDPIIEIPVRLQSSDRTVKWVSGITAATTCHDVIESVFKSDLRCRDKDPSHYILMEQWRGMEKPLSSGSRILKVWISWSGEQDNVQFVTKKVKSRSGRDPSGSKSAGRLRRRNSVSSNGSRVSDILHPKKLAKDEDLEGKIEGMMKVIMSQGKIICDELSKLSNSPAIKEANRSVVDPSGGGGGGGDFNASGEDSRMFEAVMNSPSPVDSLDVKIELRKTKSLSLELARLHALNEELHSVETKYHILSANLQQFQVPEAPPDGGGQDLSYLEHDLMLLKQCNDQLMGEIDRNKSILTELDRSFHDKRELIKRLEYDVNVIEKEGRKMSKEYEKVLKIEIPELPDKDKQPRDVGDMPMSLEESQVIYYELKELQKECQNSILCNADTAAASRTLTMGSPGGSSSSGVSSGSENCATLEKVSPKKDKERLRDSRHENVPSCKAGKKLEVEEDASDTGLGSLHSSEEGDDGTLV